MKTGIALCAALALPEPGQAAGKATWIHVLPAGEITTLDGRGPYRVADAAALIRDSMRGDKRLPLDENHATDLAAPKGAPAPARGWIVALQSRVDGIWGQVEWTDAGRQLVSDRAYRYISPAIRHTADGKVVGLLRASLVNNPNLLGLASLHAETAIDAFMAKLRGALGLDDQATEAKILDAIGALVGGTSIHAVEIEPLAALIGLPAEATSDAVLQAVSRLADPAFMVPAETVVALQAEILDLRTGHARERAELAIDAAIRAGKIAQPARMRAYYIARHMKDPDGVETEFAGMISMHARGGGSAVPPGQRSGAPGLDADELRVASLIGIDAKAFEASKSAITARAERE